MCQTLTCNHLHSPHPSPSQQTCPFYPLLELFPASWLFQRCGELHPGPASVSWSNRSRPTPCPRPATGHVTPPHPAHSAVHHGQPRKKEQEEEALTLWQKPHFGVIGPLEEKEEEKEVIYWSKPRRSGVESQVTCPLCHENQMTQN